MSLESWILIRLCVSVPAVELTITSAKEKNHLRSLGQIQYIDEYLIPYYVTFVKLFKEKWKNAAEEEEETEEEKTSRNLIWERIVIE